MTAKKKIWEIVLLFLAFFLPGFLWPSATPGRGPENLGPFMVQFIVMAVPQILLLLYIIHLSRDREDFALRRPRAVDLLYGLFFFLGIFTLLAACALLLSLLPDSGRRWFLEGYRFSLGQPRLIPLVLLFSLVTGYREELFFRAYLLTRFSQLALPAAAAVALSTLLFATGHLYQGAAGFSVAAIQGLYFAMLYLRCRNVHRLALAHALYNTVVLVMTLFIDSTLPG